MTGKLPTDSRPWAERRDRGLHDQTMRTTLHGVTRRFQLGQEQVFMGYPQAEADRQQAVRDKRAAIQDLDHLVDTFRAAVAAHGGEVRVAATRDDALHHVLAIARDAQVHTVVKSKSMMTEELQLNRTLASAGLQVLETDLGEYIIQRAGETPSHILAPAAHKSRHEIEELFVADASEIRIAPPATDDAAGLTAYARRRLREEFLSADMGVTGGNFWVAETGTVVLITNEGNADLVVSLPRVLVSIVGVEKVVKDWASLSAIIQQPAMNGIGQRLSSYTTFVSGPGESPAEGPQQWHVILVDNGRQNLRGTPFEDVLSCIRCGACLNACPVFRQVGGHAYGSVYSGPIGVVETPLLTQWASGAELPSVACTLCHACGQVCPMDIDLPGHIVRLRREKVRRRLDNGWRGVQYRIWGRLWAGSAGYRRSIRWARSGQVLYVRQGVLRGAPGLPHGWFATRDMPPVAAETFHEWWHRTRGGSEHDES